MYETYEGSPRSTEERENGRRKGKRSFAASSHRGGNSLSYRLVALHASTAGWSSRRDAGDATLPQLTDQPRRRQIGLRIVAGPRSIGTESMPGETLIATHGVVLNGPPGISQGWIYLRCPHHISFPTHLGGGPGTVCPGTYVHTYMHTSSEYLGLQAGRQGRVVAV